jgi:putative aldouronate transport system substrate-binding protein
MKKWMHTPVLCSFLLVLALTGCGGSRQGGSAAPQKIGDVDISQKIDMIIYTIGGANPRDMDMVNEAASKITLEKLNATVSVQVMGDWRNRYQLVLSSGEPVDLIWTAMWYSYQPYAFDGAWVDITEMVDKTAPELKDLIGKENWDMARINGRHYAIPTSNRSWGQWGVAWREDLRKKMGTPPITDIPSMEAYAEGILKNYPGMIPFCDSASGGLFHSFSEKNHAYIGLGNPQFSYGMGVKTDNPRELFIFHETSEFQEYLVTQRRWVERGYTQPDVASSNDQGNDGMLSGKYAGSVNSQGIATTLNGLIVPARTGHPDWEIGYMNFGEMFKWTYRAHPTFMAFAIPKAARTPERSLLFVRELLTNKELWQLYDMGIEGTHYKIEDGYYASLNDPINPGYLQSASSLTSFFFRGDFKHYSKDYQWALDYERDRMAPYEVTNYFEGFPDDYTPYRDKVTAMSEVNSQYTWPLLRGTIPNPLEALKDVNRRLDDAGRQEVVRRAIEQYQAYLDGLGIPK